MQYHIQRSIDPAPCEAQGALRQMQREAEREIEDPDKQLRCELEDEEAQKQSKARGRGKGRGRGRGRGLSEGTGGKGKSRGRGRGRKQKDQPDEVQETPEAPVPDIVPEAVPDTLPEDPPAPTETADQDSPQLVTPHSTRKRRLNMRRGSKLKRLKALSPSSSCKKARARKHQDSADPDDTKNDQEGVDQIQIDSVGEGEAQVLEVPRPKKRKIKKGKGGAKPEASETAGSAFVDGENPHATKHAEPEQPDAILADTPSSTNAEPDHEKDEKAQARAKEFESKKD